MVQKDDEFKFTIDGLPTGEHQRAVTAGEAEEFLLKKLEESKGEDAEVLYDLFVFYIQSRQPDKASLCGERLIEMTTNPEERSALFMGMGCVAEQKNDYASAEIFYRNSLRTGVSGTEHEYWAYNNLGYSLNQLGRPAEAEPYLHRAIAIDPTRCNAFKNLGLCYQGLGRFADAAVKFMEATRVNAADIRSLVHLDALVDDHPELYDQVPELEDNIEKCRSAVKLAQSVQPDFDEWWRKRRAEQDKENEDQA
jgi:tetratricopeptide (TPR) repeat protein